MPTEQNSILENDLMKNMAIMLGRLVSVVRRYDPDNVTASQAMQLMERTAPKDYQPQLFNTLRVIVPRDAKFSEMCDADFQAKVEEAATATADWFKWLDAPKRGYSVVNEGRVGNRVELHMIRGPLRAVERYSTGLRASTLFVSPKWRTEMAQKLRAMRTATNLNLTALQPATQRYMHDGTVWRHAHGGVYRLESMPTDAESGAKVVRYTHVYPYPEAEYTTTVDRWLQRFRPLSNEAFKSMMSLNPIQLRAVITERRAASKAAQEANRES